MKGACVWPGQSTCGSVNAGSTTASSPENIEESPRDPLTWLARADATPRRRAAQRAATAKVREGSSKQPCLGEPSPQTCAAEMRPFNRPPCKSIIDSVSTASWSPPRMKRSSLRGRPSLPCPCRSAIASTLAGLSETVRCVRSIRTRTRLCHNTASSMVAITTPVRPLIARSALPITITLVPGMSLTGTGSDESS